MLVQRDQNLSHLTLNLLASTLSGSVLFFFCIPEKTIHVVDIRQ